jgi:hypothetical protein
VKNEADEKARKVLELVGGQYYVANLMDEI